MPIWNIENSIEKLEMLDNKIKNAYNIAIFWHDYVDGDCIGSMFWLGKILEKLGKAVNYYTSYTPSNRFDWIEDITNIQTELDYDKKVDLIIFVDFNHPKRTSKFYQENPNWFDDQEVVTIDHHLYDRLYGSLHLIDTTSSSCAELIREISNQLWPTYIDKKIAEYIYIWTASDTWNFKHEKDTIRTFSNVIQMIWYDINKVDITNKLQCIGVNEANFIWVFLWRYKISWHIGYTYIDDQDLIEYDIDDDQAKAWQSIIRKITWPDVSIVFSDKKDGYSASMRTNSHDINLSKIATHYGWWWHQKAAWFTQQKIGDFQTWIESRVNDINSMIK